MPGGCKIDLQIYCAEGWVDIDDAAGVATVQGNQIGTEQFEPPTNDWLETVRFNSTNNLVDRILGRAENGASGEVGWRVVEILDAAYRSAQQGGRVVRIEELYR